MTLSHPTLKTSIGKRSGSAGSPGEPTICIKLPGNRWRGETGMVISASFRLGLSLLMLSLSFERSHYVLCLTFSGPFTTDDLDSIDPALVWFLAALHERRRDLRCLFDMRQVECLAVSQARFRVRAGKTAIGDVMRVVVAPSWAGPDFGQSYREGHMMWSHAQPIIVPTLEEGQSRLGIAEAHFEPIAPCPDGLSAPLPASTDAPGPLYGQRRDRQLWPEA